MEPFGEKMIKTEHDKMLEKLGYDPEHLPTLHYYRDEKGDICFPYQSEIEMIALEGPIYNEGKNILCEKIHLDNRCSSLLRFDKNGWKFIPINYSCCDNIEPSTYGDLL